MNNEIEKLQKEINEIKRRNSRVEIEKAWEVSKTRIFSILIVTYLVAVILFYFLESKTPWTNAFVPTLGFYLSTLSVSFFKKRWVKKIEIKKDLTR